jgi:hypothetical protein
LRREHVVITAAVLVIGDDEKRFVPRRRLGYCLPYVEKEFFTRRDVMRRVFVIGVGQEIRFDEGVRSK